MSDNHKIKRLVAVEFTVEEEDENPVKHELGEKYSYLQDPETGKFYRPKAGWEVKGEDLSTMFVEVGSQDG
jgi:hypothetical protein